MSDAPLLVLRTPSGISGDMLVAGLARLSGDENAVDGFLADLLMPQLSGTVSIRPHAINSISGWRAFVDVPDEHIHRPLTAIVEIIEASRLTDGARALSIATFELLAQAEGHVHGMPPDNVEFHEVGALDSIIDICLASALFDRIAPARFHCSALPVCDGQIDSAHGLLATPAPAVQEMLRGVPVYGIASRGETVTPTALAFLKAAGAVFGPWPPMQVNDIVRIFGGKILPGIANGAIFALGLPAGEAPDKAEMPATHSHDHVHDRHDPHGHHHHDHDHDHIHKHNNP